MSDEIVPQEVLFEQNTRLRTAILILTNVIDEIIPLLPAQPQIQERLKAANAQARLAL